MIINRRNFLLLVLFIVLLCVNAGLRPGMTAVAPAGASAPVGETDYAVYLSFIAHNRGSLFEAPANAHTVDLTLDSGRAQQATISTDGGVIAAVAADGSRFTLTVPPDALLGAETITLTPLSAAGGLAGSRFVSGVHLAPEGLHFYEAATLLVEPADPVPLMQQIVLGTEGGSREVFLQPLGLESERIAAIVDHFSAVMVWEGGGMENPEAPPENLPTEPTARLYHYIGHLMQQARAGVIDMETLVSRVRRVLQEYYFAHLEGLLAEASGDCAVAYEAIPVALQFDRFRELFLGDELEDLKEAVHEGAWAAAVNCWEEAVGPCLNPDDAGQMAEARLAARQAQLLGGAEEDFNPDDETLHCGNCANLTAYTDWRGAFSISYAADYERSFPWGDWDEGGTDRRTSGELVLTRNTPSIIYYYAGSDAIDATALFDEWMSWYDAGTDTYGSRTIFGSGHTGVPPVAPPSNYASLTLYPETCEYSLSIMIAQNVTTEEGGSSSESRMTVALFHAVRQPVPPSLELAGTALVPIQTASSAGTGFGFTTQNTVVIGRHQATTPPEGQARATVTWTLTPGTGE